jgi:hypothetical protein
MTWKLDMLVEELTSLRAQGFGSIDVKVNIASLQGSEDRNILGLSLDQRDGLLHILTIGE